METLTNGRRLASREKPNVYATITGVPVDDGGLYRIKESNGQELFLLAKSIMQRYYIPPADGLAEAIEASVRMAETAARVNRTGWTDEAWIDDAKEIMGHIDGSVASLLNGHISAMFRQLKAQQERINDLEEDVRSSGYLLDRQSDILRRTANYLHGGPCPNGSWSHHDLPERAAAKIADTWDEGYAAGVGDERVAAAVDVPEYREPSRLNPHRKSSYALG